MYYLEFSCERLIELAKLEDGCEVGCCMLGELMCFHGDWYFDDEINLIHEQPK